MQQGCIETCFSPLLESSIHKFEAKIRVSNENASLTQVKILGGVLSHAPPHSLEQGPWLMQCEKSCLTNTEIAKSQKYYFVDLGIRNALIQAFNPINLRDDVGKLWENFFVVERMKLHVYRGQHVAHYFWRTYDQQEIDLVEEHNGRLRAFECKYSSPRRARPRDRSRR